MLRLFVIGTLIGLISVPVHAGQYRLEHGRGVEVCEAFEKNLVAVAPNPMTGARMCPLPVQEELAGFQQQPVWKGRYTDPLPVPVGVDLQERIDRYIWKRGTNPAAYVTTDEWPAWRGTSQQLERAWNGFRQWRESFYSTPANPDAYAVLDIDNDGVVEPVYHDNRTCHYEAYASVLLVLTPDYANVDATKTDRLMVHPARSDDAPAFRPRQSSDARVAVDGKLLDVVLAEDALRMSHYDAFRYRDKTYLTLWGFEQPGQRDATVPLHVYLVEKNRRHEICTYRFSP